MANEIGRCKDCVYLRRQQSATERGDFCLKGICNTWHNWIDGHFYENPETFYCAHFENKTDGEEE